MTIRATALSALLAGSLALGLTGTARADSASIHVHYDGGYDDYPRYSHDHGYYYKHRDRRHHWGHQRKHHKHPRKFQKRHHRSHRHGHDRHHSDRQHDRHRDRHDRHDRHHSDRHHDRHRDRHYRTDGHHGDRHHDSNRHNTRSRIGIGYTGRL